MSEVCMRFSTEQHTKSTQHFQSLSSILKLLYIGRIILFEKFSGACSILITILTYQLSWTLLVWHHIHLDFHESTGQRKLGFQSLKHYYTNNFSNNKRMKKEHHNVLVELHNPDDKLFNDHLSLVFLDVFILNHSISFGVSCRDCSSE